MTQRGDAEFLAAAVGEVAMAWGHTQRTLLYCRRTRHEEVTQLAVELYEIGNRLTGIEDLLRSLYRRQAV